MIRLGWPWPMDYSEEVSEELKESKVYHALLWLLGRSYSLYFSNSCGFLDVYSFLFEQWSSLLQWMLRIALQSGCLEEQNQRASLFVWLIRIVSENLAKLGWGFEHIKRMPSSIRFRLLLRSSLSHSAVAVCDMSQEAKGYRCKQSKWLLYSRYHSNLPGSQRSVRPYSRSRLQKLRRSSVYYCNQPGKLITKGQDNPRMPNLRHLLSRILILFRRRRQYLPAEVRTEMNDQETNPFLYHLWLDLRAFMGNFS